MEIGDYPALYQASDLMAVKAQRKYLAVIFMSLVSVILASSLTLLSGFSVIFAIGAATLLIFGLISSSILALKRYDKTWFQARAAAESIKTITWRYVMRAKPFDDIDEKTDMTKFVSVVREILDENIDICEVVDDNEQITDTMSKIRQLSLRERIKIYDRERIDEQSKWYLKKAKYNRLMTDRWFFTMIGIQILAFLCSLVRIAKINWDLLPTGVLATAVAAALSWMQIKRFQELSSSYNMAAHEIGLIKVNLANIADERDFSEFVGDSENAFSREHTQWQARRDIR